MHYWDEYFRVVSQLLTETIAGSTADRIHAPADRVGHRALHKEATLRRGDQIQHECQGPQLQHGKAPDSVQQ